MEELKKEHQGAGHPVRPLSQRLEGASLSQPSDVLALVSVCPLRALARKSSMETVRSPRGPNIRICSVCSFVQQTFAKCPLSARHWAGLRDAR